MKEKIFLTIGFTANEQKNERKFKKVAAVGKKQYLRRDEKDRWKEIKHFKEGEFYSPDLQECRMEYGFVRALSRARVIADVPFKINSGYRTPEHNKKVGGKNTSSHLKGVAADIHCNNDKTRSKIIRALVDAGFRRIGIARTFIHVDSDPDKADAIWLYR